MPVRQANAKRLPQSPHWSSPMVVQLSDRSHKFPCIAQPGPRSPGLFLPRRAELTRDFLACDACHRTRALWREDQTGIAMNPSFQDSELAVIDCVCEAAWAQVEARDLSGRRRTTSAARL